MKAYHPLRYGPTKDSILGAIILLIFLALISFFLAAAIREYFLAGKYEVTNPVASSVNESIPTKKAAPLVVTIHASQVEKVVKDLLKNKQKMSSGQYFEIPDGTKLLNLYMKGDTITIDLSEEFTSGGGANSMIGRVSELKTALAHVNKNYKLKLKINGRDIQYLGGEGLELE